MILRYVGLSDIRWLQKAGLVALSVGCTPITSCDEPQQRWEWKKSMCELWHKLCPGFGQAWMLPFTDAPRRLLSALFCVVSAFAVSILSDFFFLLNMFFLPVLLCCSSSSKILESGFAGLRCVDVHECMLVAPPTEWVCVVLWLIPLFRGLMEFNTHKHSGLNT